MRTFSVALLYGVERKRPARIGTGATVLLDELLDGREGAVLGDLVLEGRR